MSTPRFSMEQAVRFGWATMKRNFAFYAVLLLVLFLIMALVGRVQEAVRVADPGLSFLVSIASFVLNMIIGIGLARINLHLCDNEKASVGDFMMFAPILVRYMLASLLYIVIIVGGMLLLIVPGVIWAIKYNFFAYLIVDRNLKVGESLKRSAELTQGIKGDLFIFVLLLIAINIGGLLCLFIGLFATIPTTLVASAYVYRVLEPKRVPDAEVQELPPETGTEKA